METEINTQMEVHTQRQMTILKPRKQHDTPDRPVRKGRKKERTAIRTRQGQKHTTTANNINTRLEINLQSAPHATSDVRRGIKMRTASEKGGEP